jgi:hypothetical protein
MLTVFYGGFCWGVLVHRLVAEIGKKNLLLEQSNCESDRESDGEEGTGVMKTRELFSEVFTCSALEPGAAPVGH